MAEIGSAAAAAPAAVARVRTGWDLAGAAEPEVIAAPNAAVRGALVATRRGGSSDR